MEKKVRDISEIDIIIEEWEDKLSQMFCFDEAQPSELPLFPQR